ncbi:MAG: hypothetical protein LQ338_003590 [Usnochroma carphineum]|nr:MAG: hypothetical protein LQ338_003590 [Usnochroma carphineum]
MAPYPNAYQIEEMFANRGIPDRFHQYLADPIDVTVVGQEFHIGGNYKNMQDFHDNIYARVAAGLKEETIRVEVRRVIGGGDSAWAAVESYCTAESKYGMRAHSEMSRGTTLLIHSGVLGRPYVLEFVDLVRFDSNGKIAQMKEFLDSGHIHSHVEEHESKTKDGKENNKE